jgi:serine/threonine protein kinase/Flp pilus assembly protein TadD
MGCLMRAGLHQQEDDHTESFVSLLAAIDVGDTDWRIGNYEILEEIGRGGMGVIYRARQRHSRRIVALKRVLSYHSDSPGTLSRFRREAEAAASLDHPNILPIYEVGESEDGLPFFSMKYAAGGSLLQAEKFLRREPRRCIALMAKVARAVQYAHGQGILHRDLKPGNILLDGRGEPLVSDFGLAKWLDTTSDLTRTLTIFGTPGFIAPEQARGPAAKLTPAADVYSLGAILFDLFAGRPPFLGEHALAVIQEAAEKPAPKLRSLAPAADRDLETICARCLEREPAARYRSAAELAHDLECWLGGKPIKARRVLPTTRAWRWSRRNPHIIATAATCLAVGAAAICFLRSPAEKAATNLTPEKSVAVLPFESLNNDQDNGLLASGMQDDVLSNLAKIADLKVIGANSVREYKAGAPRNLRQIAQTLGVRNVVEGSVRRIGTRIRVSARLTDTTAGKQFWAQEYDREPENIFGIESELAKSIASQLQVNLSPLEKALIEQQPTTDLQAYELYAEARELLRLHVNSQDPEQSVEKAVELLEQATQRDPNFALAYCQIVIAQTARYIDFAAGASATNAAKQAVDNALRLAPDLGETHLAMARYYSTFFHDYDAALRELVIARRSLPNDADAVLYTALADRRLGRWDDAVAGLRKLAALDPKDATTINVIEDTYVFLRRYREAEDFLKKTIARVPEFASHYPVTLAECYLDEGDLDAAQSTLAKLPVDSNSNEIKRLPSYRLALYRRDFAEARNALVGSQQFIGSFLNMPIPLRFFEGVIARAQHDDSAARAAFNDARREVTDRWGDDLTNPEEQSLLGVIYAFLGQKDEAIRRARHALVLRPITKDSIDGTGLATNLAVIYLLTGERELALQQLEQLAKLPGWPSYGDLKYSVWWDDLRGDPRFEQIVASLAPKDAKR